ncbi:MAG: hypothetical protein OES57_17235, partial [Acidimicrobiia bacterium]|nr:hypothetical protein [Acidimicrobiia bacterium]
MLTVMAASVVAACAVSDIDAAGTDGSAPGDTTGLLVAIEDPAEPQLLLVDASGRRVGAVDLSLACGSACGPRRVFATAGAAHWYMTTDEGVVAVDRVSASAEIVAPGSNVLVDPAGRRHLVVDDRAGQISVID